MTYIRFVYITMFVHCWQLLEYVIVISVLLLFVVVITRSALCDTLFGLLSFSCDFDSCDACGQTDIWVYHKLVKNFKLHCLFPKCKPEQVHYCNPRPTNVKVKKNWCINNYLVDEWIFCVECSRAVPITLQLQFQ